MSQCQKCSYGLVFLPNRLKYKCALCSKLYPQKEIEIKEFRDWNKRQKDLDFETLKQEIIQTEQRKLKQRLESLSLRSFRLLFKDNTRRRLSPEEQKNKKLEYDRAYYYFNKEDKDLNKILWIKKNKEHYLRWRTQNRLRQLEIMRSRDRIQYYRIKQKLLTDRYLKNKEYKAYTNDIFDSVPTSLLCELLAN